MGGFRNYEIHFQAIFPTLFLKMSLVHWKKENVIICNSNTKNKKNIELDKKINDKERS